MSTREAVPERAGCRDERWPKRHRLRKRFEYLRVQRIGRRCAVGRFVVLMAKSRRPESRIGITVSKKVGGAVTRNRIKRYVREVYRRVQHDVLPPRDILVIARPSAADATFEDVRSELVRALGIEVRK